MLLHLTLALAPLLAPGRPASLADSSCSAMPIEPVHLAGGQAASRAARDSVVRDVIFWLRPSPASGSSRSASVWVRVSRRAGVQVKAAAAGDSAFARAAYNAVVQTAAEHRFDRFVPTDSAAIDSLRVFFGQDTTGRVLALSTRRVCFATPRPGNPPMNYPRTLRVTKADPTVYGDPQHPTYNKKNGIVTAVFRVDTLGAVVPGAIAITASPNELFSREVLHTLPSYRYFPASIDGRPTEQVVQQQFEFAVDYGEGAQH